MTPHEELLQIVRSFPRAEVQNKLMTVTDRELALSMMYLSDSERSLVLSRLGKQKAERVREELRLQEKLRITYGQYLQAVNNILEKFRFSGSKKSMKSYLRPVRQSKRNRYS